MKYLNEALTDGVEDLVRATISVDSDDLVTIVVLNFVDELFVLFKSFLHYRVLILRGLDQSVHNVLILWRILQAVISHSLERIVSTILKSFIYSKIAEL